MDLFGNYKTYTGTCINIFDYLKFRFDIIIMCNETYM